MSPSLFVLLFGTWFALIQAGVPGPVNWLLAACCLMLLHPVVQGRPPFS